MTWPERPAPQRASILGTRHHNPKVLGSSPSSGTRKPRLAAGFSSFSGVDRSESICDLILSYLGIVGSHRGPTDGHRAWGD